MERPAIGLVVYKDAGANTVAVTDATSKPPWTQLGQRVSRHHDQGRGGPGALRQRRPGQPEPGNRRWAALLSLLVIMLFLGDWRAALAIGLIVPLSVLVSLTALQLMDVTINVLSLGGLALGVGLLVDNAIVVAEATARYLEQG